MKKGVTSAKNAACGIANGPQDWAIFVTIFLLLNILDHGPATTTMPYNQGTKTTCWHHRAYNQPPPNHQSGSGYWTTTQAQVSQLLTKVFRRHHHSFMIGVHGDDSNKCMDACGMIFRKLFL